MLKVDERKAYLQVRLRNLKRKPVDIVVNNEKIFNERSSYLSTLEKTVTIEGVKVYER